MNAYSILHNYDQPLYSPDFNFINAALSYKQDKLDNNRAKLQNMYDQFPKLQVAKGVDKEYIESRLQQVRQISSKYEMLDLSDDTLASSLLTNAAQIFDDKVKEAVVSTKRMEIEDKQWAEALKKADGKYNQTYHEYALAMSDRQRYLSTQEAGDRYRGGADFIAYTGTEKKVAELTAKAAEQLKQKAFESRGSGGYFNYQDTYEFTDKNTLRQIVESSLDDNDRKHFQIMGWKQFQGVDDNNLRNYYKEYNTPKVENSRDRISALEVLRGQASGEQKELYDREIENEKENFRNLQSRLSDETLEQRGRQGLASELYYDSYLEGTVSPYASKRLVDRDIDEVQKANVTFAETVRQHEFENSLALAKENRLAEKEKYEIMKLKKELGIADPSNPTDPNKNVIFTDPDPNDPDNAMKYGTEGMDGIQLEQKQQFEAINSFNKLVGIGIGPGDYAELRKSLQNINELAESGGAITIKGRKVDLTDENLATLIKFKNNVLTTSPSRKSYRANLDKGVMTTIWQLGKTIANNGDMSPEELPNFGFEIVEKNGSLVKQDIKGWDMKNAMSNIQSGKTPITSSKNNYAALLKRVGEKGFDSLSRAEQATLKAYTTSHIIGDPNMGLSSAVKREYFYTLRDETLKDMDIKEFSKIAKDYKEIEAGVSYDRLGVKAASDFGTQNKRNKWFEDKISTMFPGGVPLKAVREVESLGSMYRKLSQLTGADATNQKKAIQAKEEELRRIGGLVTGNKSFGSDYYLSELTARDLDYNKNDKEVNFSRGIEEIVKQAVSSAQKQDDEMQKQGELLSIREVSFVKDHSNYEKLKNYAYVLGLTPTTKGYQDPIKARLIQNGQGASDQVEITVTKWKTENNTKVKADPEVRTVSLKEFEENTDIKLNAAVRTDYTSKFGKSAAKIDLGTGIPKVALENSQVAILNQEVRESLPGMDEQRANQVKALLDDYIQGKFRFKAEVLEDNQPYYISVYKNGKFDAQVAFPGGTEKGGIKDFSYDDVVQVYRNSSDYATLAFQQYLYSIYPELRR
jgi:hypothetical protein